MIGRQALDLVDPGQHFIEIDQAHQLLGELFGQLAPALFAIADDNRINAEEAARPVVFRGSGDPGAQVVLSNTGTGGQVGPRSGRGAP